MKDYEYEDGHGWFPSEDLCLSCGDDHYRASNVPGVCVECVYGGDLGSSDEVDTSSFGYSLRSV